jgi:hypothetical protein
MIPDDSSRDSSLSRDRESSDDCNQSSGENSGLTDGLSLAGDERNVVRKAIQKETKDVRLSRELVMGMMLITATLVTASTYILFSRMEVQNFTTDVSEFYPPNWLKYCLRPP